MSGRPEVYVSIDIETDGPIPGEFSMLSLGAVAYDAQGTRLGSFSVNLQPLAGARQDPETMQEFWAKQPAAWLAATTNQRDPAEAMREFAVWSKGLGGPPVAVCYPAGFDWTFIRWYQEKFTGSSSPYGLGALDIKTFAMGVLGTAYRGTVKRLLLPGKDFGPHTHVAVEDAEEQGRWFLELLRQRDDQQAAKPALGPYEMTKGYRIPNYSISQQKRIEAQARLQDAIQSIRHKIIES